MSYQVLARKWRPQRFDDVLGQQAVTRTLANALKTGRLAHAFVFAGPRGCGKTTTARILARALNCVKGPTVEPCGVCEACVEIAEGRDIDVLEIDAATHTGVDNVREVIIEGLSIAPVRSRYKIFLIDEVHMLSSSSFNALLKSIEEPPPHVIFMMATTELQKIPDTVRSRSQVFEFRTIAARTVVERLRHIANEESIQISDDGLALLARAGEGSMRDSLSAFDQVRAFAGDAITADDVITVLGLIGRDLVLDILEAVDTEDAPAAFALVERALERGYDLRLLCRELSRTIRDLLVLSVDPARAKDTEIASEGDRDRLQALAGRASREDLLRAFDELTRAEQEIKTSDEPRYSLEMTLLRLMHLRKLVPLTELITGAAGASSATGGSGATRPAFAGASPPRSTAPASARSGFSGPGPAAPVNRTQSPPPATRAAAVAPAAPSTAVAPDASEIKDRFLAAIKSAKAFFYNTVVANAYRIDVAAGRVTFSFLPNQKVAKAQCDESRAWLEGIAEQVFGRKVAVAISVVDSTGASEPAPVAPRAVAAAERPQPSEDQLRTEAMSDPTAQALFEIFPVEKSRVEEI